MHIIICCLVLAISLSACFDGARDNPSTSTKTSPTSPAPDAGTSDKDPSEGSIPNSPNGCSRSSTVKGNPETIEDLVLFINALPKPLSLACFMEALPRPLSVHIASKSVSGQTTSGTTAPRIFLFLSPSLVITVVPAGSGARKVEIGFRISPIDSIKGEIAFPVVEKLALDAPYETIVSYERIGTQCSICHTNEQKAGVASPIAFSSSIIVPDPLFAMSLKEFEAMNTACEKETKEECAVIQAIFSQGQVIERSFL